MENCCGINQSNGIVVSINGAKLRQGDLRESTLLAFALNPTEFEEKLESLGLAFDGNPYEDIDFLVELHKIGGDKSGILRDNNGNKIIFDLLDFIRTIKVDNSSNNPIKTVIV